MIYFQGGAGSTVAKGFSGLAKFGIRTAFSSGAGAVSGAIGGLTSELSKDNKTIGSVLLSTAKSAGIGAIVGTVGGAASGGASSAAHCIQSEVGKVATRLTVQGATAAVTDISIQCCQDKEFDWQQTLLNTVGQVAVASTAEATSAAAQRTSKYANKISMERIDDNASKDNLSADHVKEIKTHIETVNALDKTDFKSPNVLDRDRSNLHVLEERTKTPRVRQVSVDFGEVANRNGRLEGRVILEQTKDTYVYLDHTLNHDYKNAELTVKRNLPNPLQSMKIANIEGNISLSDILENDDDD